MKQSSSSRLLLPIHKHTLAAYFSFAFLISWVFWFCEPALRLHDPLTATFLVQLGSYGPVLAAMLVSRLSTPDRLSSPLWPRLAAGSLTLAVAIYCAWPTARTMPANGSTLLHWFLLGLLILLPAWIFFNARSSHSGVQNLLNSQTCWRTNPIWFATALLLMLALGAAGTLLVSLFNQATLPAWLASLKTNPVLANLLLTLLATALYGGPVGEEAGWRGLALPHLQKRFDPLLASVILGVMWALWHLPLHLTGYYNQAFGSPINGILLRAFTTIPLALIFTWLYNRTGGNLLVMVCLHTAVNVSSALIPPGPGLYVTTTLAVVLMVLSDRMYRKPALKVEGRPI
jgi:uncharacterized protein